MSDSPKLNSVSGPMAYRRKASRTTHNAHKPASDDTYKPKNHRKQAPVKNETSNASTKKAQKPSNKRHITQKADTSNKKTEKDAEPHFMTNAEVREWFREAEAEYEKDKKAGRFDSYVPAASRQFDCSAFVKQLVSTKTEVRGLENSIHNPNRAQISEAVEPQDQPKEDQAKNQGSSQPQQSNRTAQKPTGASKAQGSHAQRSKTSQKGKGVDCDQPHYMSDAELKQWYIDADREYEEKKKAGYNKDYVPAGGHPPAVSSRASNKENGGAKPAKGMASSMHAPKKQE
ncbi:hypothetical protein B0T20DRAFT_499208 [Sordaria brevicollis]|uniref:Uncharacterized protein n=1 Tax=Sordaria brevicollis TaxID=83679 RepID=A0AAE0PCV7_SORBR|nr:hypothetical protein B0T20DRAFT_499208 [Sordaria brevicollis]